MATKDSMKNVEALFKSKKKGDVVTLENIAKESNKQPTAAQAKKINKFATDVKVDIISASEFAKYLTAKEVKRREEAREELMKFLDKAHLSGAKIVKIIHGIGNGVLKKVCEEVLEETPYVVFYREGTPKEGGAGVTIAQLE